MPGDPGFNPLSLQRIQVYDGELERMLDMMDRTKMRYVAGGGHSAGSAQAPPKRN
jgi:hypothetical protein